MKKIFITGAAGFIAFHTAAALRNLGWHVEGVDNFNSYYSPSLKKDRARRLKQDYQIDILNGDIAEEMPPSFNASEYDVILHLAAQPGVRYSITNPQIYLERNLKAFVELLEACKKSTTKVVYASSSSVYGHNKKVPFSEDDPVDLPGSMYAVTKRSKELTAYTYHKLYGIPLIGLRFFTVIGSWGRPDMAYYSFAKNICKGLPIKVFGEGKVKRDFTHISDIVSGIISAINLECGYEIFNLGNNTPETVLSLISSLEKHLGKKALVDFQPLPLGDLELTYADISKANKRLGFTPKVSLDEGIEEFVDWFLSYESGKSEEKLLGSINP